MTCAKCKKPLSYNERGLNEKFNQSAPALCIRCLAEKLDVTEERLREKIAEYLRAGCLLFVADA